MPQVLGRDDVRCGAGVQGSPAEAGNVGPVLAHSGGQATLHLSARQPGQSKVLVHFQGCSELGSQVDTPYRERRRKVVVGDESETALNGGKSIRISTATAVSFG